MVTSVRTERGTSGLEVVKETDTDEGRARLRHEADLLARAAQPGVVEVIAATGSRLRLRHRGTSLSRLGALPPDHVAAVVRSVAEVVESLHRQGIVHTRIDTDHVVIGDRGRPRLCGFAEATDATDDLRAADVAGLGKLLDDLLDAGKDALWSPIHRGPRNARRRRKALSGFRAAAKAARRDDPGQRPTARQFATALHDALPDLALPVIPAGGTAPDFASIPADIDPTADLGWTDDDLSYLTADAEDDEEAGDPFEKLAALSDTGSPDEPVRTRPLRAREPAGDDDAPARQREEPWSPPSAADFEAAFGGPATGRGTADDHLRPVRIRPGRADTAPPPATTTRTLVVIAVVVLVLGAVAGVLLARAVNPFESDQASATAAGDEDDDATTTTSAAEEVEAPAGDAAVPTPPPYPPECTVPDLPGPDTDGDGCPEAVAIDGRRATVGNVSVELGREGDLPVLADHDCDGVLTPVLLRSATGEVFVFPGWSLDEPVEIDATTTVAEAERIEADAEPCGPVTVVDRSGAEHVVAGPGA